MFFGKVEAPAQTERHLFVQIFIKDSCTEIVDPSLKGTHQEA